MEVQDLRVGVGTPEPAVEKSAEPRSTGSEVAADSPAPRDDALEISGHPTDPRVITNNIISVVNVANDATNEIGKLVESISGIAELAKDPNLPESRRSVLEKEANQLVDEIRKRASSDSNGVRPLLGDKIRLEVEQKYGKALDIVLPDSAQEAFGLGTISFSKKEAVLDTITSVQQAQERLRQLQEAVHGATQSVRSVVDRMEVGFQNQEAAQISVRNVDHALMLATDMRSSIAQNPQAVGVTHNLDASALELLK